MTEARYVSVPECAEVLGVSDDLVYELVQRGELPAVALGRRKVIPVRALELVEQRALEGFDPDAVLTRLAGAVGPSGAVGSAGLTNGDDEGPSGATRPEAEFQTISRAVPKRHATASRSVVPIRT